MNTDELCDQIIELLYNEFQMPFVIAAGPSHRHFLFQSEYLDFQFPAALSLETSLTGAMSQVKRWIKTHKSNIESGHSYVFDAAGSMRKE